MEDSNLLIKVGWFTHLGTGCVIPLWTWIGIYCLIATAGLEGERWWRSPMWRMWENKETCERATDTLLHTYVQKEEIVCTTIRKTGPWH